MSTQGKLILEDGTEIIGKSFGAETSIAGEVVFNTAMNGYPENLTDPSYRGQILVVTFPLVGNYGVPKSTFTDEIESFFESSKIHIKGLIVSYYSEEYSHWNAEKSLGNWLKENNIPALYDVDTRMITKILRENGSMSGKIIFENDIPFHDPNLDNLVDEVSTKEIQTYRPQTNRQDFLASESLKKVVLVDCGVKNNIIRCLLKRNVEVTRVPWNYNFNELEYDGLFLSNGPGDPKQCTETIENIKIAMTKNKPIFGICLGNQLLGLAAGADTHKLKYGHRGYNQPVREYGTNKCFITTQNHGYVLDEKLLSDEWELYFTNLNDGTCEGIKHKTKPFFSVQFHPEASGGPTDTEFLFDEFVALLE